MTSVLEQTGGVAAQPATLPSVVVEYVDGPAIAGRIDRWREFPGQAVGKVRVVLEDGREIQLAGSSLYWIRELLEGWGIGQAACGYSEIPPETVLARDGRTWTRELEYVPDLEHADVKLGWWNPGTEGVVVTDG